MAARSNTNDTVDKRVTMRVLGARGHSDMGPQFVRANLLVGYIVLILEQTNIELEAAL